MSIFNMDEAGKFARALADSEGVSVKQEAACDEPYSDTDGTIHIGVPSVYNEDKYMGSLHREISKQSKDMGFFNKLDVSKNPLQQMAKSILQGQRTEFHQHGVYGGRDRILSETYDRNMKDAGGIKRVVKNLADYNPTAGAMMYLGNEMRNDWQGYNYCECPKEIEEEVKRLKPMLEDEWLQMDSEDDLRNLLERIQYEEVQEQQQEGEGDVDSGQDGKEGDGQGGDGKDQEGNGDSESQEGDGDEGEGDSPDSGESGDGGDSGEENGEGDGSNGDCKEVEGSDGDSGQDGGDDSSGEGSGTQGEQRTQGEGGGSPEDGASGSGGSQQGQGEGQQPSDQSGTGGGQSGKDDRDTGEARRKPDNSVGATDAYESLKNIGIVKEPAKPGECVQPDRSVYHPKPNDLETTDITKSPGEVGGWSKEIERKLGTFSLTKKIKKYLISQSQTGYELGKKRGKICSKNIGRIYAGHQQPRIFKERSATKIQQDTAMFILGDCSGSMSGSRYATSASCQIAMSEVLKVLQIQHMMMQFSTGRVGRQHYIMKHFSERSVSRDTLLKRYGSHRIQMGCNADGEAVTEAAQWLARRPEENKILIVLSDGSPAYGGGDHQFLIDTVKEIEDSKIMSVIGIGIETHDVQEYYRTSKVVNELSELERVLLGLLKEKVLK